MSGNECATEPQRVDFRTGTEVAEGAVSFVVMRCELTFMSSSQSRLKNRPSGCSDLRNNSSSPGTMQLQGIGFFLESDENIFPNTDRLLESASLLFV